MKLSSRSYAALAFLFLARQWNGHAAEPEPKTHAMFVGADIAVMEDKKLHPVEDVQGGSFVVRVDGKEVKVPTQWSQVAMKVEPAVKISSTPTTISGLTFERAYTPENDPAKMFARQQGEEVATEQRWNSLVAAIYSSPYSSSVPGAGGKTGIYTNPTSGLQTDYNSLNEGGDALKHRLREMDGVMFSFGERKAAAVSTLQQQLAQEMFDAIQVEFDLTSPIPVRKPYVVIMARFHEREAQHGQSQNWLYAAELDHLDAKPNKVRLLKGGFPPGYILESHQIHVYDGTHEIVTNLSSERVDLTRTEAFKYIMIDYLASRKKASASATPIMGMLSMTERETLGVAAYHRTYFVKVSSDGLPIAAFTDRALTEPVDTHVGPLLANVRFLPALTEGKPVEAVAELNFSRLSL